jgi:hypothetical protein
VAPIPSTDEIADPIATMLASAIGGDKAGWIRAIGPVEVLPILFNVQSNGRLRQRARRSSASIYRRAANIVRGEHPYVKVPGAIGGLNISRREMRK